MYNTKKEYLKRIDNISIHEMQKIYRIDDDIIEFLYDYSFICSIQDELKIDDGGYILESLNNNDIEVVKGLINGIVDNTIDMDNLSDYIMDYIDGKVDIYNYNLNNWLHDTSNAWEYMENVIQEQLIDINHYDFYNHIQAAQIEYYYNDFYNTLFDNIPDLIENITEYITEKLIKAE